MMNGSLTFMCCYYYYDHKKLHIEKNLWFSYIREGCDEK